MLTSPRRQASWCTSWLQWSAMIRSCLRLGPESSSRPLKPTHGEARSTCDLPAVSAQAFDAVLVNRCRLQQNHILRGQARQSAHCGRGRSWMGDRTGQTCAKWTRTVAEVQMQLLMLLAIQSIHSVVALSLDVNITCEAQ